MLSYRRAFPVNPDSLAPGHPYVFDNSRKSCQIAFYEFRGTGPPSSDYGYPGDVYVDLTPGAHALYWRDRQGHTPGQWRRWRAVVLDEVPLHKYLVSHPWVNDPQESDLYLWVDPDGVTWTSRAEICSSRVSMVQKDIATITPGERNPDVDALVAEILAKMIEVEELRTLPPIQDKRDRYSGTSPLLPGHPAERRERSQSSASQYSPREALRRIPSTNSPPHHRNTAHHPYAPSHHDRSLPPIAPSSTHSDLRDHITAAAEPHRRQTPAEYSAYRAGPSNPRASEPSPPGPSTPNRERPGFG
ncbi:hypothetical protein B0H11DRAFT_2041078 [Mycena galericulata]|nr:hypothetical protein B0H11DRAFT_2041078 [Mycena galericulata]